MKKTKLNFLTYLALAGVALALSACGKRDAAMETALAPSVTPEPRASTPAATQQIAPPAATADNTTDLTTLTQALRRYSMERRKVPADLNEVIAAGYLKGMPAAPAGKKFGINTKRLEVILVNQ